MAVFLYCISLLWAFSMPLLTMETLSLKRREPHTIACCRLPNCYSSCRLCPRASDSKVDFTRQNCEVLGFPYLRMATNLPHGGWVLNWVEVPSGLGTGKTCWKQRYHQRNKDSILESFTEAILSELGPETDHTTYATLLRACTIAKALSEGRRVHEHMSRRGYAGNLFLSNLLVQMYSKCGSLENAHAVFDNIFYRNVYSWNIMITACAHNGSLDDAVALFAEMPQRNAVSWNAMIAAFAQNRLGKGALQLFGQMQIEGFEPNQVTFICVVDACASVASLEEGQLIHATVAGNGWESVVAVENALVNMYGKCRSLVDAREVFAEMPQRNLVSWSAMFNACTQNEHGKEALQLFGQMQAKGFELDKITFICVVDACANVAALEDGRVIHAAIVGNGWGSDVIVGTALINMYGKCGSLANARALFVEMPQQNVVSWSAIIGACTRNGHGMEALQLFGQMHAEGFEPDMVTFLCIVDACAKVGVLEEGQVIHATLAGNGWESNAVLGTALINMYGKFGGLDDARAVFSKMPQRDVISWNAMIVACAQNNHDNEALQLFDQMHAQGLESNQITFICILDSCASMAALQEGQVLHGTIAGKGWESQLVVENALINMYGRCRSLGDVRAVFEEMSQRDVVSWTTVIVACSQNGHGEEALELFGQMQAKGFELDKITFICIVDVCASMASLREGQMVHARAIGNGWELDAVVGNSLVNMYGNCGGMDDARAVFAEIPQQDVVSWNAMISVCAQNGHGKEALQLFHGMQAEGIKPDKITFICVLTACSHSGLVADGRRYFAYMNTDHRITPTVEHYVCTIDLLGRIGLLEEAEDLIRNLPFKHVPSAWLSLLSSCRLHYDTERAVRAASFVSKLDPRKASSYVLLANIHANAGILDNEVEGRTTLILV